MEPDPLEVQMQAFVDTLQQQYGANRLDGTRSAELRAFVMEQLAEAEQRATARVMAAINRLAQSGKN